MRHVALLVLLGCSTGARDVLPPVGPPTVASATGPAASDSAHVGSTKPPQSFTPETTARPHASALQVLWSLEVGATSSTTTMLVEGKNLHLGTATGVTTVVATKGNVVRRTPTAPVVGIAFGDEKLFVATTDGGLLALSQNGTTAFRVNLGSRLTGAPTLTDVDGDGSLDAIVTDAKGNVSALDGKTGALRWIRVVGDGEGAGAASLVDLDGDGKDDVVAGGANGLVGVRGRDGTILFRAPGTVPLRAPPVIVDVDGDGREEIVATWTDGRIAIVSRAGKIRWSAHVEEDDGAADALDATAVPLASPRNVVIAAPTSGRGERDGVVLVGETQRAFRSREGRVSATPVVARVETEELPSAIVGTEQGAIVAIDPLGNRTALARVGGAISASLLVSDVNAEGLLEIFAVTTSGTLTAFLSPAPAPALIPRYRGASPHNDGRIPPINLPWRLEAP